ncbi:MAG: DUF2993 domain-containing protein [Limnochordia bacterium]
MKKPLLFSVVLILVGLTLTQVFLPSYVAGRIEEAFLAAYPDTHLVQVEIEAFPALRLFGGGVDRFRFDARGFTYNGLNIEAFLVDGDQLQIPIMSLLRGQEFLFQSLGNLRATVLLKEEALNQYLWTKIDPIQLIEIQLERDAARLLGEVELLGRKFNLSLAGGFHVAPENKLVFVPDALTVEELQVPRLVVDAVADNLDLTIDFSRLPFTLTLESVRLEEGSLYIFARDRD